MRYLLIAFALLMAAGCCRCPVEIKTTSYLKRDGWEIANGIIHKHGKSLILSATCDGVEETTTECICKNIVIRGAK